MPAATDLKLKTRIDINNARRRAPMSIRLNTGRCRRLAVAAGLACALALATGCGDDKGGGDDGDDDTGQDDGQDDGTDDDGAGDDGGEQPAVLVAERVFTPEGRSYYLSVLPDVPGEPVDRAQALELTSADIEVFNGLVYIRDRDANTMTRYRVSDDLALVEDGQLSFAGVGLGTGRYHSAYLTAERAYVMDSAEWRLIEWNPTTMELTGEIVPIDFAEKTELPFGAIGPAARAGDRLVSPIYWQDFENLVLYPGSGALIIDPASTEPPVFVEDARVGGAFRSVADDAGDAYLIGTVGGDLRLFGSALGGGDLPASGLLRIPAGEQAFDPDYAVDIEAITGSIGAWAVHRIDDTTVLAQVYDPEAADPADIDAYADSTDFVYVLIDTEKGTFEPVEELARGGRGNAGDHVVDGRLYVQTSRGTGEDQFETVVHAVSPEGIEESFTVPSGDVWHLQRIR
jgi:hypothetical protein